MNDVTCFSNGLTLDQDVPMCWEWKAEAFSSEARLSACWELGRQEELKGRKR